MKALWGGLDPKIKEGYSDRFQEEIVEYRKDMEAWEKKNPKANKKERSSTKPISMPEKSKGSLRKEPKEPSRGNGKGKSPAKRESPGKKDSKSKGKPQKGKK